MPWFLRGVPAVLLLLTTPLPSPAQVPFEVFTRGSFMVGGVSSDVLGGLTFEGLGSEESPYHFEATVWQPQPLTLGTFFLDRTFDFRYGQAGGTFDLLVSFTQPGVMDAFFTAMVRGRVVAEPDDSECAGSVNIFFGTHEEGGCGGGGHDSGGEGGMDGGGDDGETHDDAEHAMEPVVRELMIGGYPVELALPNKVQLKPHDGLFLPDGTTQYGTVDGSATVTPEPTTLLLLATGLALGAGGAARRRRRGEDREE